MTFTFKTIVMKRIMLPLLLIFCFLLTTNSNAQKNNIAGNWSGEIELPTMKLEMIFIVADSDSGLTATLDVPVQGARGLTVEEVIYSTDSLIFKIPKLLGTYKGSFVNKDSISGKWNQGGMSLPLNLKKTDKTVELRRPQTPKPPFPYDSEEVEYTNTKSGFKIAGTLTIPKNAIEAPAVILISGSGAQDRDETIFEHKPFLVIADYLTRNGIAVLRLDDRGVGGSGGNISEATSEDFAGDVLTGIDFLQTRSKIDSEKLGLIGHSEGGLIAPMLVNLSDNISFIVMLAGPGVVGEQILFKQGELLNRAAGMSEDQIQQNRSLQEAIFNILLNEKDSATQLDRLQRTYSGGMYPMWPEERKKAVDARIQSVNTNWFRFFLSYDPYPTLAKLKCPVLSLIGEKDLQVPAELNQEAIAKALTEAGNENFKTLTFKNLNHLFQNCEEGSISEYALIEETFSVEVLEIIKDWIWEVID